MTARYVQPSSALTGPVVLEHTDRPDAPDAVRVLFADGGWEWMEDPADARALEAAFADAAARLDAMHARKAVAA